MERLSNLLSKAQRSWIVRVILVELVRRVTDFIW